MSEPHSAKPSAATALPDAPCAEPLACQSSKERHIALLIEVPAIYTADIDELREFKSDEETESEFLYSVIGEPNVARVRVEISGEKDSEIQEVWGHVREVQLVEPSRGYERGDACLTDQQLQANGDKLMRDERACEWCQHHDAEPEEEDDA